MLGRVLIASAMRAAPDENLRSPSVPYAVELDVRQVHRQAFDRVHRRQRRLDVAGHAQVAAVHVQRVRHADVVHGLRQRLQDLPWRDAVVGMRLVEVEHALIELEGRDAARVHHLEPDALGVRDGPGDVVVDRALVVVRRQHAQQEVIAAEHRVGALVDNRRIAHLHVGLARVDRQHGRLEARGVTHLGVAVAGR